MVTTGFVTSWVEEKKKKSKKVNWPRFGGAKSYSCFNFDYLPILRSGLLLIISMLQWWLAIVKLLVDVEIILAVSILWDYRHDYGFKFPMDDGY